MQITRLGLLLAPWFPLLVSAAVGAQVYGTGANGALAPTTNITLDTTPNGGVFEFTSINIPAGVTVRLTGSNPAILLCLGSVTIAGQLDASGFDSSTGFGSAGGPGGYAGGGIGQPGQGPGGGPAGYVVLNPGSVPGCMASHATVGLPGPSSFPLQTPAPTYGSALPFDLRGGSGGGGQAFVSGSTVGPHGSGGGGTVAILAEGPIGISGMVRARGGTIINALPLYPRGGVGAGGSILLRSLQCVQVSGSIDARAGAVTIGTFVVDPGPEGAGFIRIDSYSACGAPDLTGATIQPAPLVAPLPYLTALSQPRIGQVYPVRCASAPGDSLSFYFSLGTASFPVPPIGVIELDLATLWTLGTFVVPSVGHDPLAAIDIPIPNEAWLVGVTFYAQAVNAPGSAAGLPRLSNLLTIPIGQ
jgi:hypothetical protein